MTHAKHPAKLVWSTAVHPFCEHPVTSDLAFICFQNNLEANLSCDCADDTHWWHHVPIYGYMYTLFGPPRGPQDAPPIRGESKAL
jgi:hypothetical protein